MTDTRPAATWQNRITRSSNVDPTQLLANPKNFRRHPGAQQASMTDLLETVGWVQDVIVSERTGHVLDGHMRVELAMRNGAETVPVKYVDLTDEEEAVVLATFDPVGAMAFVDADQLGSLLESATSLHDREGTHALFHRLKQQSSLASIDDFVSDLHNDTDDNTWREDDASDDRFALNSVDTDEADDDESYTSMSVTVTFDERDAIMRAVKQAQLNGHGTTTGNALASICTQWSNDRVIN